MAEQNSVKPLKNWYLATWPCIKIDDAGVRLRSKGSWGRYQAVPLPPPWVDGDKNLAADECDRYASLARVVAEQLKAGRATANIGFPAIAAVIAVSALLNTGVGGLDEELPILFTYVTLGAMLLILVAIWGALRSSTKAPQIDEIARRWDELAQRRRDSTQPLQRKSSDDVEGHGRAVQAINSGS